MLYLYALYRCLYTPSFKAHELLAYSLTSIHNIHFMMNYFSRIRALILNNDL